VNYVLIWDENMTRRVAPIAKNEIGMDTGIKEAGL